MLPLHEAAGPCLGPGCSARQQAEPDIYCLFLQRPCCKLLACHARASCMPSTVVICLHCQLSRVAQPWSRLLDRSGSCTGRHRVKPVQFITTLGLSKKGRMFLLHLQLLNTCHDSSCHPSAHLRVTFLQLIPQHIFLEPSRLPPQLHQPVPVKPGNAPHNSCCWQGRNLRPLAGPWMQYLPCNSPWWRILAIKLMGVNSTARPGQGKA